MSGDVAIALHRGAALDGDKRPAWPYLKGTLDEARGIATLWPSSERVALLEGDAATSAALCRELARAGHVHLATHGFFADPKFRSAFQQDVAGERLTAGGVEMAGDRSTVTGRNPLILSGIVLAGANLPRQTNADGIPIGDDGILTAEEVAELDLGNTELVVLSACETGLGDVAGGEGVFGLQRAFALAGTRTTIASLWKVDDAATQKLMTRFYENLRQKKLPKLEALRQAQLSVLYDLPESSVSRGAEVVRENRANAATVRADPRLWAAWVLSGDPGDLSQIAPVVAPATGTTPSAETRSAFYLVAIAVAGLLLVGVAALVWKRRRSPRQEATA
jgi:CHAT domain-containing protein